MIHGLQAISYSIHVTASAFLHHEVVWGFVFGFIAATAICILALVERPSHLPYILTKTAEDSFICLAVQDDDGRYLTSYSSFKKQYTEVRIIFYVMFCLFLGMILVSLLYY